MFLFVLSCGFTNWHTGILQDLFLLPPYLITHVDWHLTIPEPKEHDGKSFTIFLIRNTDSIFAYLHQNAL